MTPIKCWVVQSINTKYVYVHSFKPSLDNYLKRWYSKMAAGYVGKNLLLDDKKPVKCVIITEEEYKKLKEVTK